jgi:acetoin utilization protein AcuA
MQEKDESMKGGPPKEGTRADQKKTAEQRQHGKPPFFGFEKVPFEVVGKKKPAASAQPVKNVATLDTEQGPVKVENYCPADRLERLTVDSGILMFSRNNPERQKKALLNVAATDGGNVIAATLGDTLVGYIGNHHPSENERWGKPGYDWLYELGAIEVSRNFRETGMAMAMMHAAWDDPFYDDKVVLTTAYVWHWDLEATGMTKLEYRELFIELAGRFSFMEMATDEPNVAMDSANLFLVRLGRDTTFSQYQKFASLLFTDQWEAMLRGF